jgi:hypothetical protein
MAGDNERHEQQAACATAAAGRRTRRRLLAWAAGLLGVAAAEVVGKAAPAHAGNGRRGSPARWRSRSAHSHSGRP